MANPLQGKTFRRTVIVGLGSTGLDILHAFQDYWYERFGNTDTRLVKLINVETDNANKVQSKPSGTMIEQIFIKNKGLSYNELAKDLRRAINPLKETKNLEWDWKWTENVNWNLLGVLQDDGAGGVRAGGRMLLYSINPDNKRNAESFLHNVNKTLKDDFIPIAATGDVVAKDLFQMLGFSSDLWVDNDKKQYDEVDKIHKPIHNPHFEEENIYTVVVGALTGGTSSGMFIDIGHILQTALKIPSGNLKRIYGVFIVPPVEESLATRSGNIAWHQVRANAFGSIYDIIRLRNTFISGQKIVMPYGYIWLIAPEYNTEGTADYFEKLHGLTEMVALRLFLNVLGFQYEFDRQITDEITQNPKTYIFTMGTGAILYPKYTLVEMAACEFSKGICHAFIDEENVIDPAGQKSRLNKAAIKESVKAKIASLTEKHIMQQLSQTPKNAPDSVEERLSYWLKELPKDIQNNKKLLKKEFDEPEGLFREIIEANKAGMIEGLLKAVENELIQELHLNFSLYGLRLKMQYYGDELNLLRKLWEKQGRDKFDTKAEITAMLEEYQQFGKFSAPTDLDTILQDLLHVLFNNYLISAAYINLGEALERLHAWQKSLNAAMAGLQNSKNAFHDRFLSFASRLENNSRIAPVVKLFYKDKDADYRKIKDDLIGKRPVPGWTHLEKGGIDAKACWEQVKTSEKVDTEKIKNILSQQLSAKVTDFLNAVNFNIIEKALRPENKEIVSSTLKKIRSSFLKHRRGQFDPVGRIPASIVAKAKDITEIEGFIREYDLGCQALNNPILEHMIVYTKDLSSIAFEDLGAYPKMKESFLMDHPNQPEWTKLRLAYSDKVDFTIVEESRYDDIHQILEFLRCFWFTKITQPGGAVHFEPTEKAAGISYPEAKRNASGDPTISGIYVDTKKEPKKEPYLFIIVPGSGQEISLNLNRPDRENAHALCKQPALYEALKELIRPHLKWRDSHFLDALYSHYDGYIKNALDASNLQAVYESLFSANFRANAGQTIRDLENRECLVTKVYKILTE